MLMMSAFFSSDTISMAISTWCMIRSRSDSNNSSLNRQLSYLSILNHNIFSSSSAIYL